MAVAECKRTDVKVSGPNKRNALGNLLQLIRFPLMEMGDLVSKVQSSGVLTQEELLGLFTYLAAPEGKKPKTPFSVKEREGGGSKVIVEEFGWSTALSNMTRVSFNGTTVSSVAPTCNADVVAVAELKKPWSKGIHYWRLTLSGGCIHRAGIVDGEFDKARFGGGSGWTNTNQPLLGATPNSWGVSVASHSQYGEPNLYGGAAGMTSGEIGLMLDLKAKKLHVFVNGNYVGTAFQNLKGKKFRPAILLCHSGSRGVCLPKASVNPPVVPK